MNTTITNTKTTTAKRPANFTKRAWDESTFRVYNGLVKLVKGEITMSQFTTHPSVKALFESCGVATTPEERQKQTVSLIISMAKDRTSHGEKERHIAPIYRLRAFFNGEWKVKSALPVTYAEPKAPKAPAKKTSPKGKKAKAPAKKFASAEEWLKSIPEEKRDEIRVALAVLDMDIDNVA